MFAPLLGAAGIAIAVRTMAGFSQQLSTVQAVTGATEQQFRMLSETARELGATTRFTASQAGEAMVFLARSGFTAAESIETVDDTLQLALAGALDLGSAADITTKALRGFRLETSEAGRVTDVLAKAAATANTTVFQLGDAMRFVAPVAAGVGVSIEETTGALQLLSNSGLQASMAGTGLRRVLAELESPSERSQQILSSLGVTAEEVRVSQVGLTNALQRLAGSGIDAGQSLELFGQRGGPAFIVLSRAAQDLPEFTARLEEAGGFAAEVAEIMDDNLNGALLRVRSALEAVVLELGAAGGQGFVRTFFEGLAVVLRGAANNMDTLLRVAQALAITLGVDLARRAIPAFITGINRSTAAVKRFTLAIAANPLGAIATAITVTLALLVSFADRIKVSSDGLVTLQDVGVAVFEFIAESIGPLIAQFRALVSRGIERVSDAIASIGLTFGDILGAARFFVNRVIGLNVGLRSALLVIYRRIGEAIIRFIGPEVLREIGSAIQFTIRFLSRSFLRFFDSAAEGLNRLSGGLVDLRRSLGEEGFQLPDIELPGNVDDVAGEAARAFLDAFNMDFIGSLEELFGPQVANVFARARELAQERAAAAAAEGAGAGAGVPAGRLGKAREPTPGAGGGLPQTIEAIERENALLQTNAIARERLTALLAIQEEAGRRLTEQDLARLEPLLLQNEQLRLRTSILDELRGPQEQLVVQQEALNQLLDSGAIDISQYNSRLTELRLAAAEAQNTVGGGFRASLLQLQKNVQDVGGATQEFLVGTFRQAGSAIQEFARTGKINIREFVADAIVQLLRLAAQIAANQALQSAGGGAGGGGGVVGSLVGIVGALAGFQNGGDFRVGGAGGPDSQLVAFRASPGERVQVTPQGRQQQEAPQVNVPPAQVVVVDDPNKIPAGIQSPEGSEAVMTVLGNNSESVKQLLGVQ